ncbi:hypothetical protein LINPERHAP1_LOCUS39574 [Linum perenne]
MGFEICSSLFSVRLRIKPSNSLPNEISVKFGASSFTVRVIPDHSDFSSPRDSSLGTRSVLQSVGKAELTPIPAYHFGSPAVLELGSSSTALQSVSESSALQNLPLGPVTNVTSSVIFEVRKEKVAIPMIDRDKAPKVSDRCGLFVGLSLEFKDDLWLVRAHGLNRTPIFKFPLGVGKKSTCLQHFGSGPYSSSLLGPFKLAHLLGMVPLFEHPTLFESQLGIGVSSSTVLEDRRGVLEDVNSISSSSVASISPPSSSSLLDFDPSVKEAASLFGLEFDGSKDLGLHSALETSKSMLSKRYNSGNRSRKDLEWRRLDVTPNTLVSGTRSSRRNGFALPCSPPNEF